MSTLANRLLATALLDAESYEQVEADAHANAQAVAVVVLASLGAAVGTGTTDIVGIVGLLLVALASWIVWVLLTVVIGTQVMPGAVTRADFGQVLRTTGFSASPGILRILGIIPVIGWVLFLAATVWMLFSFVIAIRQAMDYSSTARALTVCLLGWIIHGVPFFGFVLVAI